MILQGHTDCVMCLAPFRWYTDSSHSFLASGSRDFTIIIWDLITGLSVRTLLGHKATVTSLCIPDVTKHVSLNRPQAIDRAYSYQRDSSFQQVASNGESLIDTGAESCGKIDTSQLKLRTECLTGAGESDNNLFCPSAHPSKSTCHKQNTMSDNNGHNGLVYESYRLLSGSYDATVKVWDLDKIIRDYR